MALYKLEMHRTIPFIANSVIIGRGAVLDKLQQKLFLQKITHKMSLYGLGGGHRKT